jgi:two-component system heavy metal sensor histidine kinase CusS
MKFFGQSITRRLVALFTLTTLVVIVLISAALYHFLTVQLVQYQQRQVLSALHDRAYQIERIDQVDRWERVDRKMATLTPADGGMRFWVLSDDPRFRFGTDLDAVATHRATSERMSLVWLPGRAYPFHVLARHFKANGQRPEVTLVVGIDTAPFTEARRVFLIALVMLSVTAAAAVYALGHFVARLGLQPLRQLSDQASQLSVSNLAQRLLVAPLPQELADVTGAFNGALDRLEHAYVQLEAFNADVAHELRTPLGNLIGLTQVALARPRSAGEMTEFMLSNLEELERLRSIVNDMLFLARADRGESSATLADACVAVEVDKAVEFLELALEEADKTVMVEGDLAARAPLDAPLFRRALVNLLHNAILYSSSHARLQVRIRDLDASITVEVINPGATIAPVHLPRLFDRFYRADRARGGADEQKGHGLGLAIVKAIAQMHFGAVFASSASGVTTIGFSVAAAPRRARL